MPAIASKSYKAGDIVFEYNPILHILYSETKAKYCENCVKRSESLKKCSKCRKINYCSKDCQQNDWKYHKNECKYFRNKKYMNNRPTYLEILLLRLWLRIKSDPNFVTKRYQSIDGSDFSLEELDINCAKYEKSKEAMETYEQIEQNFRYFDIDFDYNQLFRWFCLVYGSEYTCILLGYSESVSQLPHLTLSCPIGSGIYIQRPLFTYFMHSCLPNTNISMNGLKQEIRAMKPISSGDQLTHNIIMLANPKRKRHQLLRELSLPVCRCERCRLDLDKDIDYNECKKMSDINEAYLGIFLGKPITRSLKEECDFQIDWQLFIYLQEIYGQNSTYISKIMATSFVLFAMYSHHSSKSLIKLWYKQLEPTILISYGTEHPIYKLFRDCYEKTT